MKSVKIIGLPVIITERHRVVLDKNIRTLYGMELNDTVVMRNTQGILFVSPYRSGRIANGEIKALGNGRFNLPQEWVKEHRIDVGDFIYLIATSEGIMLCAKNMELLCVEEME